MQTNTSWNDPQLSDGDFPSQQTKLYLAATQAGYQGLSTAKQDLCVRDIGYFIDAVSKL